MANDGKLDMISMEREIERLTKELDRNVGYLHQIRNEKKQLLEELNDNKNFTRCIIGVGICYLLYSFGGKL